VPAHPEMASIAIAAAKFVKCRAPGAIIKSNDFIETSCRN
jgi:hypothetical protein